MYQHKQVSYPVVALTLALAAVYAAVAATSGRRQMLIPAAVVILVAAAFRTLAVRVDGGVLRFHFGPGVWRKQFPLAEIAAAERCDSRWWEGVGIRLTGRGVLYDVAVGPAVEVRMRSGKRFRVGTNEPDALLRALAQAPRG
jgi:hypothetical protein